MAISPFWNAAKKKKSQWEDDLLIRKEVVISVPAVVKMQEKEELYKGGKPPPKIDVKSPYWTNCPLLKAGATVHVIESPPWGGIL